MLERRLHKVLDVRTWLVRVSVLSFVLIVFKSSWLGTHHKAPARPYQVPIFASVEVQLRLDLLELLRVFNLDCSHLLILLVKQLLIPLLHLEELVFLLLALGVELALRVLLVAQLVAQIAFPPEVGLHLGLFVSQLLLQVIALVLPLSDNFLKRYLELNFLLSNLLLQLT